MMPPEKSMVKVNRKVNRLRPGSVFLDSAKAAHTVSTTLMAVPTRV